MNSSEESELSSVESDAEINEGKSVAQGELFVVWLCIEIIN